VVEEPWTVSVRGAAHVDQALPLGFVTGPEGVRFGTHALLPPDGDPPEHRWSRATGLRTEQRRATSYAAELATDHPTAAAALVELSLVDEATLSVVATVAGATACQQSFVARAGERFYGFGERSHAVAVEEGVVENYVGEGPFQPHEYPFLTETVPPWGIRNRPDATYFPVPWVLSTRGFGLLLDNDEVSYERIRTGDDGHWSVEVESGRLAYRLFAGPRPLDALARFTAAVGRQPAPERWWFGPWHQSGHANHVPLAEERRQVDVLQGAGAAGSAAETHCRYLPLGEDRGHEEDERARTASFHGQGLAVLSYLNPLVGVDYAEAFRRAEAAGVLLRRSDGDTYLFRAYVGGREPPHTMETEYDFTHPDAADAWGEVAARVVAAGYDGWMEDFGEYTPLDAVSADGSHGTAAHNRYPTRYHAAAATASAALEAARGRRLARFVRSGWTGTAAVAPIVWGGDPTTSWGFDGLASAVKEGLSMGASGVAAWGSDTGGFMSSLDRLTPELLVRWIQFSAFCPVMRTKAGGIELPPYDRPQIWDDDVLPVWRRWSQWHTRLNDYLMAAHAAYRRTGRPIMCALELVHPGIGPIDDQYLLGPDLLVAPVLAPGATSRRVTLPPGRWFDLFDSRRHFDGSGSVDLEVGIEDVPVLVRAGAVLGLLPTEVASLSPYAAPLPDRREVWVFPAPGQGGSGDLGPGVAYASSWQGDEWSLRLMAPRAFRWEVAVRLPHRPADAGGRGVEGWSWEDGTLRGTLSGASPSLSLRIAA